MLKIKLESEQLGCVVKIVKNCVNAPRALVIRCRRHLADCHYVPYTGVMSGAYARKGVLKDETFTGSEA